MRQKSLNAFLQDKKNAEDRITQILQGLHDRYPEFTIDGISIVTVKLSSCVPEKMVSVNIEITTRK